MNTKNLLVVFLLILALGIVGWFSYFNNAEAPIENNVTTENNSSITYNNSDYGFTFRLPQNWSGYTIVEEAWNGNPLGNNAAQNGPKLLIRNPKWRAAAPYEDLPILVFTLSQWNSYLAEEFAVGAAPIQASELGRNNKFVFALPARWDFDYSLDVKEAQDIFASDPLHTYDLETSIKIY
jgi:hypothetical protein